MGQQHSRGWYGVSRNQGCPILPAFCAGRWGLLTLVGSEESALESSNSPTLAVETATRVGQPDATGTYNKSPTVVSSVMRLPAIVPTICATWFPNMSYASSVNLPVYCFPSALNVISSRILVGPVGLPMPPGAFAVSLANHAK